MKIGVMVESFRLGLAGGLQAAADLGADGVQIYATSGETHPSNLKGAARKALRVKISDLGLGVSALCGDFGGHGFQIAEENEKRIEDSKRVMELALELGTPIVTTHIGVVPSDRSHKRYGLMAKAMARLSVFGESVGGVFAIETGPEPSTVLRDFLDEIGAKGVGVNFDPANLVMVIAEDIPAAVATLGRHIVHTHAKDGINLKPVNAERLYGVVAGEEIRWQDYIREVPLGEGKVGFDTYLAALRKTGYDGYLTIEREVGDNPKRDIQKAIEFLKKQMKERSAK